MHGPLDLKKIWEREAIRPNYAQLTIGDLAQTPPPRVLVSDGLRSIM